MRQAATEQDALKSRLKATRMPGDNRATDGTTHVEAEYLEVVATRG